MDQVNLYVLVNVYIIVFCLISICPNILCLFLGRVGLGYSAGILKVLGPSLIYQFSPQDRRAYGSIICVSFYGLGAIVALGMSFIDDGKSLWKILLQFPLFTASIIMILRITYFKDFQAVTYLVQNKIQKEDAQFLDTIMEESDKIYVFQTFEEIETKLELILKDSNGQCCFLLRYYNKELIYGTIICIAFALAGELPFFNYILQLGIKNPDDDSEKKFLKMIMTISPLLVVLTCIISAKFNLAEFRKVGFIVTILAMSLMWVGMGASYLGNSFLFPKFACFVCSIFSASYGGSVRSAHLNDVCNERLISLCYGFYSLTIFLL